MSLKFPQLAPRYHGVPRRYEETKPVIIQDFTHRKIVGIGHDIQRRLLDRLEREKTETVKAAEEAIWEEAEKRKDSALRRVKDESVQQIQQRLDEAHRMHEQHLKEECLKVEMMMQKQAIEQVQEERAKAERILKETVQRVEEKKEEEKKAAVAAAREEEKRIATEKLVELVQKQAVEIEKLRRAASLEKERALSALTKSKDAEREKAVKEACEREQKIAKEELEKLKKKAKDHLAEEARKLVEKIVEIEYLKTQIESIEKKKERVSQYLMVTRKYFQDFIDRMKAFEAGQSDYMLPPAYLEEIERGLMIPE